MTAQGPEQCVHCGSCTAVCPVYRSTGRESLTARGKLHLLGRGLPAAPSPVFQDLFARCLLCGACEKACPRGIPIRALIVAARSRFPVLSGPHGLLKVTARFALARPALLEGLIRAGVLLRDLEMLPGDSGLRLKLGLLRPKEVASQAEDETPSVQPAAAVEGVLYFAGCLARHLQPAVAGATGRLVRQLVSRPLDQPPGQTCCGLAAWSAGATEEARRLARRNIRAFAGSSGPVLTSCASCAAYLAKYPELFADDREWREQAEQFSGRVREFSTYVLESAGSVALRADHECRVYYHQPCHLRFAPDAGAAEALLRRIANVTLVASPEGPFCCGQGGLFHLGCPELAEGIFRRAHAACAATCPDLVVTGCSGCLLQWQAGLAQRRSPVAAVHLAEFLASCLNIDS